MHNMSTPKRRRLGNTKIMRLGQSIEDKYISSTECRPFRRKKAEIDILTVDTCDSPQLPCNQVEFLCDSVNNSSNSTSSDIPCSPCVFLTPETLSESLDINRTKNENVESEKTKSQGVLREDEDIFDDMFHSKFEQSLNNHEEENNFRNEIEESFNKINNSLSNVNELLKNKTSHFETNDSFLLDIKDSSIINAQNNDGQYKDKDMPIFRNDFYGLPMITKGLFKTYRNIDKFYDWQEECLNLNAIKKRRNLIYALPTSGGKTLVAEVLMLREVLNQKRNALFILPFVAIVQEKIWALSPFAVQLEFLVEEYAAGKGHIPPKKRRKKNSIYVATIEKGLALVRSLIELNRLHEIGLIVVDELHLIGEKGRGGTLEMLLSIVLFANQNIQIVGMSATIGNLHDIAKFLKADVFQRQFRPVELVEYVKLGNVLHKIQWADSGTEIIPDRELVYDYSATAVSLDPDLLGGLVSEVVPGGSCLVFCPTKRNCENVAALLCKLQRREMTSHRIEERRVLEDSLRAEGASVELCRSVRYGIAFHHAGLASDERSLLEHAFRCGVISVLCCTSTLAAGVNLPAQRVLVRAPLVGRELLTLGAYRQMAGRAGRAGVCDTGESIIICNGREWPQFREVLSGGLAPVCSQIRTCANSLVLSAVALELATCRRDIRRLMGSTLMAVTTDEDDFKSLCDESLRYLLKCSALEVRSKRQEKESSEIVEGDCYVYNDSELIVSKLGRAAIKGCMDLSRAKQLVQDLVVASKGLVLMGSLHLLYLVTPHDADTITRPDYRHYYSLYCNLDAEGVQTAKILGITEMNAVRMMTGKTITNVPEKVLCRFYLALMLHDLWQQVPFSIVADKYCLPRGTVQSVMSSASAFASCAHKFCEEMEHLWTFGALFAELATRLQHCAAPELCQLMELPAVKKARALQLSRAGYKRIEDLAKASVEDLMSAISHLSRTAANQLISAARMTLIEKVENLRAEAEDVMEELNI